MKYPKEVGPQTQSELYAWLFSQLGAAYNMLAQYEAEEMNREMEAERERIENALRRVPRPEPDFSGFTEGAHREDDGLDT